MFSIEVCSALAIVLIAQTALAQESCQGHAKPPTWSYENQEAWPAQSCRTKQYQSPININLRDVLRIDRERVTKSPLKFENYREWFDALIENDGRTVRVSPVDNMTTLGLLSGGPLGNRVYKFSSFHFHWPSEHTFSGYRWPLELQILHHRADLTPEEALNEPDGYAIVAIFFYQWPLSSRVMDTLYGSVQAVRKPLTSACQRFYLGLLELDPFDYIITYKGSLTTPNCNESVIWILLQRRYSVSREQLENFSKVDVGSQSNHRQLQPLNGRTVYYRNRLSGLWEK